MEKNPQYKTLIIGDTEYRTTFTKKYENRNYWMEPDPRKIVSFIPGTVLEVLVKEGQAVKAGDTLMILEAMKMRNKITAPLTGKIKFLNVRAGDKIPKGHLLFEIA